MDEGRKATFAALGMKAAATGIELFVTFEEAADRVRAFFATHQVAGLELPDGWFGRPFDNLHELTLAEGRPLRLLLELDGRLLLTIAGPIDIVEEGDRLVLRSGAQIVFDAALYGSDEPLARSFHGGVVVLHGQGAAPA